MRLSCIKTHLECFGFCCTHLLRNLKEIRTNLLKDHKDCKTINNLISLICMSIPKGIAVFLSKYLV